MSAIRKPCSSRACSSLKQALGSGTGQPGINDLFLAALASIDQNGADHGGDEYHQSGNEGHPQIDFSRQ